jgi:capsular polysaccharide biosynthesis protein
MYDPTHDSNERTVPRDGTQASATYAEVHRYFTLRDVLRFIRRRLWVVILVALVSVGAAVGLSLMQTPVYQASTKIKVDQEKGQGDQFSGNLAGNVEGLQQLVQTMLVEIEIRPVAEEVIRRLGLQTSPENILGNLTVEQIGSTQVIQLSYRDTDPEQAQAIANAISEVSSERISEVSAGASNITATVLEPAVVPSSPVSPDPVRNGLLALGLGLMLGLGLAFLLEYLDDSWRSPEEVEQVSGIPTFGVIPEFEFAKNGKKARLARMKEH